jgi:hypothetical protein
MSTGKKSSGNDLGPSAKTPEYQGIIPFTVPFYHLSLPATMLYDFFMTGQTKLIDAKNSADSCNSVQFNLFDVRYSPKKGVVRPFVGAVPPYCICINRSEYRSIESLCDSLNCLEMAMEANGRQMGKVQITIDSKL